MAAVVKLLSALVLEKGTDGVLCCRAVVPEGYYLKGPGQVAPCPMGEYKSGFGAASSCVKCATGVTTNSVGSSSEAACVVVLPTFYPSSIVNGTVKSTAKCPQKYDG